MDEHTLDEQTLKEERETVIFQTLSRKLQDLMKGGELDNSQIIDILGWESKLVVGDFLEEYAYFNESNLPIIHDYILQNLDHPDRLFVSDLIEFAWEWNLDLPYEKCLDFLDNYNFENKDIFVQSAVIDYIFKNLKMQYIDRIIKSLERIINNPEEEQFVQVKADLVLFRITHKRKYLMDLLDLVVNEGHREQVLNLLKDEYNKQRYFDYHDFLKTICTRPKK